MSKEIEDKSEHEPHSLEQSTVIDHGSKATKQQNIVGKQSITICMFLRRFLEKIEKLDK